MTVWIPQRAGRDAIGELPANVELGLIPRRGEAPAALLDVEFLVLADDDVRTRRLLARMRRLKVIQTLSAGVDWLLADVPPGVTLCDAGGARDATVAEWVLAAILASIKELPELRDRQREHAWRRQGSSELAGRTVMILGYGSIGAAVEKRLLPFDVELIRVARTAREKVHAAEELDSLLPLADVLVILLPLTPATAGLLDGDRLGRLPDGALLVNAARGPIVDTAALTGLLQARRLRAALDVTEPEPLPRDHPLWDAPGALITPHLAGDGRGAARRAFELVGEQIRRYARHAPLANIVEHGY